MRWKPAKRYHQTSTAGYTICVISPNEAPLFEAWGPPDRPDLSYWKWTELRCKADYALGERVPSRRECLGSAATPEEARAICERHYAEAHPELALLREAAA